MQIRYSRFSLLLIFLTACHSAGSRTEPEPAIGEFPSPLPSSPQLSPRSSWTIQPTTQVHRYRSEIISIIIPGESSAGIRDSISAIADFALTVQRDTKGLSYSASVEAFSVRGQADPSSPMSLAGRLESSQFTLNPPVTCTTQANSVVPALQRLVIPMPLQLRKGQTWTDSTSATLCSGSIPVTLIALRSYRVIGEISTGARTGVLLERQDKTLSAGEGSEGQHRIQLRSEGGGQTQLLIDSTTGAPIELTVASTLTITVTTSGRSQKFIQTSREHVTER